MSKSWDLVPLGEILIKSENWIELKPTEKYKQITVKIWGKGVVERNEVTGAEIAASKRLQVKSGQFIVSRIDARHGAFGLIPDFLDNAVVTNDFPVFTVNQKKILPQFLDWMSKTADFVEICKAASEGTTNRVRLKEAHFLAMKIPLPPLEEQRRIVARVEELAGKIEEARSLRQQIIEKCDELYRSIIFAPSVETTLTPMNELLKFREPDVVVSPEETYHFAGVYSFGKGVFKQQSQTGMEFSYKSLTRLKVNNFIYPKLMAWEGGLGIVPPECDGLVVSPEFPVFEVDENRVLPETLDVYFRTPFVWSLLANISTGTNIRRRRLHPSNFLKYEFPLPSIKIQMKLRAVKKRGDEMKRMREQAIKELDALLPSILDKAFKGEL